MSSPSDRNSSPARVAIWFGLLVGLFGTLSLLRSESGAAREASRPALLEPAAHEGATSLAFPSETELLSVDAGGTLKRWDLVSRRTRAVSLVGRGLYRKDTMRLVLDPTGSVCVSVLGGGDTCYGLDLSGRGSAVRLGRLSWARPTSDGKYAYGAEEGGSRLYLFPPGTAAPARTVAAGPGWRFSDHTVISPLGRYAAAVVRRASGWEVVAGDARLERWTSIPSAPAPADLQFSPDGNSLGWIEGAPPLRKLQIRSVGTWKPKLPSLIGDVSQFRFSPDGRRIATLGEVERGYLLATPLPERRRERVIVLRIHSQRDVTPQLIAERIRGHAAQVTACVWSPTARKIATLDEDGRIALWNGHSGQLERFLEPHG